VFSGPVDFPELRRLEMLFVGMLTSISNFLEFLARLSIDDLSGCRRLKN